MGVLYNFDKLIIFGIPIYIHPPVRHSWDFGWIPGAWGGTLRPHEAVSELRCCQGIPRRGRWDPTVTVWKKSLEVPGKIKTQPVEVGAEGSSWSNLPLFTRVFVSTMQWWWILAGSSSTGNKIVFSKFGNSETARCSNCCLHSLKRTAS